MMRNPLLLFCLSLFLIQCSSLNVYRGEDQKNFTSNVMKVETGHYFWGLLPSEKGLLEQHLCPESRLDAAQMGMSFGEVLIGVVTLGIYVPSRVMVSCAK